MNMDQNIYVGYFFILVLDVKLASIMSGVKAWFLIGSLFQTNEMK